ncbi:MAG: gliding motility-associated ABC transporter substrate-binding protein GldG [Bacteroidetes bacterium]|jgi:ABC-2 type transport system permease protein|nr:gliding motility-associated ABC transporter substrate-binding protein GldG [Bacteroidota bacterium]
MIKRKQNDIFFLFGVFALLVAVNILGSYAFIKWDWTEEKKYTLTESTRSIVDSIQQPMYIRVLLEGNFPAGFKRLQNSTREFLNGLRKQNPNIEIHFENPSSGSTEQINKNRKALSDRGIVPVNFRMKDGDEVVERLIYPYAIVAYGEQETVVNLLEEQTPGSNEEVVLNNSISLLEYKFANAFHKLRSKIKPIIAFTEGHGEISPERASDFRNNLNSFYQFGRFTLDSATTIPPTIKLIIVAQPRKAFTEKEKFILDQFIMDGGSILWLVNRLDVHLDSLHGKKFFIPPEIDFNLDDLFFNYGFRVNPDLVLDLECSKIPLRIGQSGGAPQIDLFPWYYHPVVQPNKKHPITKNMGRVNLMFANSIDSLKTKYDVEKTALLSSSRYSRKQFIPMRLNFEILRYEPEVEKFNTPNIPMGYLLEGKFSSLYENRITQDMMDRLEKIDVEFLDKSKGDSRMAVVTYPEIITNESGETKQDFRPMGFNPYERRLYDNKQFMSNLVEYLINGSTVLDARSKEVKLRMLDTVRARKEKLYWQTLNIGAPLLLLCMVAIAFYYWRRKNYGNLT